MSNLWTSKLYALNCDKKVLLLALICMRSLANAKPCRFAKKVACLPVQKNVNIIFP
jgi:hypothetical protein